MKLTAANVEQVFTDCLSRETGEITPEQSKAIKETNTAPEGWIICEGVVTRAMFNKARLEGHREDIFSMLSELPAQFLETEGGGWSFLNACMTRDNEQWGEHRNIDCLICLGIGLGLVSFPMPKEMWHILPGGMPYFCVKNSPAKTVTA